MVPLPQLAPQPFPSRSWRHSHWRRRAALAAAVVLLAVVLLLVVLEGSVLAPRAAAALLLVATRLRLVVVALFLAVLLLVVLQLLVGGRSRQLHSHWCPPPLLASCSTHGPLARCLNKVVFCDHNCKLISR